MANFEAKVTSKGQITLPAKLRSALRIAVGDKVVFSEAPGRRLPHRDQARNSRGFERRHPRRTRGYIRRGKEMDRGGAQRSMPEGRRRDPER